MTSKTKGEKAKWGKGEIGKKRQKGGSSFSPFPLFPVSPFSSHLVAVFSSL
jgi:hypothetical protein